MFRYTKKHGRVGQKWIFELKPPNSSFIRPVNAAQRIILKVFIFSLFCLITRNQENIIVKKSNKNVFVKSTLLNLFCDKRGTYKLIREIRESLLSMFAYFLPNQSPEEVLFCAHLLNKSCYWNSFNDIQITVTHKC